MLEARDLPSGKLRWRTRLKRPIGSNVSTDEKWVYVKTGTGQVAVLTMAGKVERYLKISDSAGQAGSRRSASHTSKSPTPVRDADNLPRSTLLP
jgi:hypothetical protein